MDVEVWAYHVRIRLRKPVRHASHARTTTDNLIVRVRWVDGVEGIGEGVPREYVTGESIDSALELLRQSRVPTLIEPSPPDSFLEALRLAEAFELPVAADDPRGCRGNAARCAVELALLDGFGKRFGLPVSEATRLLTPDLWQPLPKVQYSGAITSAAGFKARLAAWMMRLYGFRQCKVKVGIAGQDDVARLRAIRRRVGRKMDLRVDANEAWAAADAVRRIRELEPFGISSVEQPIAHEEFDHLADIRRQVSTPIMLDESLCSLYDAERAIAADAADLFNLRLSKCGGYIKALRLAEFARRHGLGYQLGCQVGETAILSAAGRHFACSVAGLRYLEGSYDRRLVQEALATRDLTFGYGGWAPALAGPGLGIVLDEAALERTTIRKEQLCG